MEKKDEIGITALFFAVIGVISLFIGQDLRNDLNNFILFFIDLLTVFSLIYVGTLYEKQKRLIKENGK